MLKELQPRSFPADLFNDAVHAGSDALYFTQAKLVDFAGRQLGGSKFARREGIGGLSIGPLPRAYLLRAGRQIFLLKKLAEAAVSRHDALFDGIPGFPCKPRA